MGLSWLHAASAKDIPHNEGRHLYRFFEMLPGGIAWFTIAGIFVFSWLAPMFTSFFIIAFDLYWLFKTVFLSIHLRAGYREMRRRMKINWREKLDAITIYPAELGINS